MKATIYEVTGDDERPGYMPFRFPIKEISCRYQEIKRMKYSAKHVIGIILCCSFRRDVVPFVGISDESEINQAVSGYQ